MTSSARTAGADQSTRRRILAATFVVLARDGRRKLQLSDVAAEARVSRADAVPVLRFEGRTARGVRPLRAGQFRLRDGRRWQD